MYGAFSKPFSCIQYTPFGCTKPLTRSLSVLSVHFNFLVLMYLSLLLLRLLLLLLLLRRRPFGGLIYIYPQKTCLLLQRKKHTFTMRTLVPDRCSCMWCIRFYVFRLPLALCCACSGYTFLCSKYTKHAHGIRASYAMY